MRLFPLFLAPFILHFSSIAHGEETMNHRPAIGTGVMLTSIGTIDFHERTMTPAGIVFGEADFPFSRFAAALAEIGAGSAWDAAGHSRFIGALRGGLRWKLTDHNFIDTAIGADTVFSHEVLICGEAKYVRTFGHHVFATAGVSGGEGIINPHPEGHEVSGPRLAILLGIGTHLWEQ